MKKPVKKTTKHKTRKVFACLSGYGHVIAVRLSKDGARGFGSVVPATLTLSPAKKKRT